MPADDRALVAGCIELVLNRKTKEPFPPYTSKDSGMAGMMKFLRDEGVFAFSAANLLMTNPPLITTEVRTVYAM